MFLTLVVYVSLLPLSAHSFVFPRCFCFYYVHCVSFFHQFVAIEMNVYAISGFNYLITHTHVEHADLLDFNWNVDAFNPGLYSIISFHVRMCEYIFLFFMGCCYISHGSLLIINRKKKNGTYEWNEKNEASIRWWKRSEWENERALTN